MTNKEIIDQMFPYYEDMEDLEMFQTASRRVGAQQMAEWKDEQFAKEKERLVEKAVEWVDYHNENGGCLFDGWQQSLKQAMKGE